MVAAAPNYDKPQVKDNRKYASRIGIYPAYLVEEARKDPTMQNIVIPGFEVAAVIGGAILAPEIVIPSVLIGQAANIGISSVAKSIETGTPQLVLPTTVREVTDTAVFSTGFGFVGAGAMGGLARVAPRLVSDVANPLVRAATKLGVNTGLGAGASGVLSGGDPKAIGEGAAFGFGFGALGLAVGKVAPRLTPKKTYVEQITTGKSKGIVSAKYSVSGDVIEANKQISFETQKTQIKNKSYAKFLRETMKDNKPTRAEFEGTEKTNYIIGETMQVRKGAVLFEGPAEPFIEAAKNKPFVARMEDLGKVETLVASNKAVSVSQTRQGSFLTASERSALKTMGVDSKVMATSAEYHDVKLWAEMTPKQYTAMLAKFKTYVQPDIVASKKGAMKPMDLPFKQAGGLAYAQLKEPTVLTPKVKVYTDIVGVETTRATVKIPQLFIPIRPQTIQTPKITPINRADLASRFIPKSMEKTSSKVEQISIPKQAQKGQSRMASTLIAPNFPKQNFAKFPGLGLGGGFGNPARQGKQRYGKWFEKKHVIKTPNQMLRTFGLKPLKPIRIFKTQRRKRR